MRINLNIRRLRGFGLVEVLVGMVISLLAMLVIMQLYALWEGQKRTTTSGSDAQSNGVMGLYSIERDVRQAGYGFASLDVLNCNVRAYNANRTPTDFTLPAMAPVTINPVYSTPIPAPDANTDIIQVSYGNSNGLSAGVSFNQQSGASANYQVTNRSGFTVGDMVIAVEPGLDCSLAQVTDLPAAGSCNSSSGGQTDVVIHNNGNFQNPYQGCANVPSYWNKPSGLGVTYTTGKLYDLGSLPVTLIYAVRNARLTVCDYMANDCTDATLVNNTSVWVPIADNIVGLHAQYGRDTATPVGTSGVGVTYVANVYDQNTPINACGWLRTPVIRIGLVARSPLFEKGAVTTTAPTWQGGTFDVSATANWQHYRYKTFETIVPLRNIIWIGAQSSC